MDEREFAEELEQEKEKARKRAEDYRRKKLGLPPLDEKMNGNENVAYMPDKNEEHENMWESETKF